MQTDTPNRTTRKSRNQRTVLKKIAYGSPLVMIVNRMARYFLCHFNKMRVFLVVIHAMVACACSDYMRSVVEYYQPCSACDYFMWLCDNGTRTWDTVESVRSTFKYIQDG